MAIGLEINFHNNIRAALEDMRADAVARLTDGVPVDYAHYLKDVGFIQAIDAALGVAEDLRKKTFED